jgi:hypothetical protein
MNYLVPTYLRVGSTLLCEALSILLDEKITPLEFTEEEQEDTKKRNKKINETSGIIKTHCFYAYNLLKDFPDDCLVFYSTRNFIDVTLSRLLYEKDVRTREGLPVINSISQILSIYPNIESGDFLDLFVETNEDWLEEEAFLWKKATIKIIHPKVIQINYDDICENIPLLIKRLSDELQIKKDRQEIAINYLSFDKMKKRHTENFLRFGQSGKYESLVSAETIIKLKTILNKVN